MGSETQVISQEAIQYRRLKTGNFRIKGNYYFFLLVVTLTELEYAEFALLS